MNPKYQETQSLAPSLTFNQVALGESLCSLDLVFLIQRRVDMRSFGVLPSSLDTAYIL